VITPQLLTGKSEDERCNSSTIKSALHSVREHLGMDVAYVTEFDNDQSIFRYVDSLSDTPIINVNQQLAWDNTLCQPILNRRLPKLIADIQREPLAQAIPFVQSAGIGRHIGVPVRY